MRWVTAPFNAFFVPPPSSHWSKPVGMAPQFNFIKESGFRELK
jgi:hypothetical protein